MPAARYMGLVPIAIAASVVSATVGYYLGNSQLFSRTSDTDDSLQSIDSEEEDEDYDPVPEVSSLELNSIPGEVKMILVIRQDLNMTKGKIAAQCCHASLGCYRSITDAKRNCYNPTMASRWLRNGQPTITLKCPDKEAMDFIYAQALSRGVNCNVVHDAGRTQVPAGSATVLGMGPAPALVLDEFLSFLKLY